MAEKLIVYRLRKYLRRLYEGYPSHFFYNYEKVDGVEEGIKHLLEDGIIKEEEFIKGHKEGETPVSKLRTLTPIIDRHYRLTAEGLRLVELWNTEKLTWWLLLIAITQILLLINLR